ncbi:MAG: ABC transporter permease [Nisaea sp.]|jgi:NitT/TauT family transport system permease protein|uniref:ABC transporter permease n=1 Tax=Nisaea sp. TaxID=2024842 RepID=UPI001B1BB6E5|nr:ABC transporter permease [Nisaea sp.]MBO6560281.1 ABC transporter permease [Nisaea sp.]
MPEANAPRPVPFRGGGFRPKSSLWVGAAVFALLITLWEIGSRTGIIHPLVLPAPSEAAEAFIDLYNSGLLWKHLGASLSRLAIGWTAGTLLGIAVGFSIGLFSLARAGLVPLVAAIFPIPKIALLPLFIIWFGIGEGSKVATILFGTFFPTVVATYGGVDNVDRGLIRMGQSFGLSWFSIVRKIILPGALPAILPGFRISAAIAIVLLVAAEMIGAEFGVGAYILLAGSLMAMDQLIAGVAILSAIGLTVSWIIGRTERLLLRWRT